jgi:hypothetical protein
MPIDLDLAAAIAEENSGRQSGPKRRFQPTFFMKSILGETATDVCPLGDNAAGGRRKRDDPRDALLLAAKAIRIALVFD